MRKGLLLLLLMFLCACSTDTPMETQAQRYSKVIDTSRFAPWSGPAADAAVLPGNVRAVIVPHGGEALGMAAQVIAGLAESRPGTVILLGPNHTVAGPKIAATYAAFSTYDGMVLPREDLVRSLAGRGLAGIDDSLFEEEHSVGILMPLLARYLPGTKVVPLIFQKNMPITAAKNAINTIYGLAGDAVIVASIDFSHDLPAREELDRREKMLDYIRAFDCAGVFGLDATYVDAPVLLAALLQLLKDSGCGMELIAGANTAELLGMDVPAATGYMTIVFYAKDIP